MDVERLDDKMVRRAVSGDKVALTVLLRRSRSRLRETIAGSIPPDLERRVDADDVVQEAHVAASRTIRELKNATPDGFDGWLFTIARSKLRDALRRFRAAKRGGGRVPLSDRPAGTEDSMVALLDRVAGPDRTPSRVVARAEAVKAVESALADISEQYREAIWLVHIEGRPIAAAAKQLGKTDRAVHGLLRRGLKELCDELGSVSGFLSSSG